MIFYDVFDSTIGMVVFPLFSKIQEDKQRLMNSLLLGTKFYLAASIPFYLGLASFSSEAISLVFGNQWSQATGVTMLLAISGPFQFAPLFIHAIFQATGGPGVPLTLNTLRAVLSLILFPIGSLYGLIGIATAFMIRSILAPVADIIALKIKLSVKIRVFVDQAKVPLFSSIFAILISKGFMHLTFGTLDIKVSFLIAIFLGTTLYALSLMLLDRSLIYGIKNIFKVQR
jgi:O-antigen/teichoic acid export membrane protein